MNLFDMVRLLSIAVTGASLAYSLAFIVRRFRLHGQGATEAPATGVLSPAQVDALSDSRMRRDTLSHLSHSLTILGLVISILAHPLRALQGAHLGSVFGGIVAVGSPVAFTVGGAFLIIGGLVPLVRRLRGAEERLTRTSRDVVPLVAILTLGIVGIFYAVASATDLVPVRSPAASLHLLAIAFFIFCLTRTKLFHAVAFFRLKAAGIEPATGIVAKDRGVESALSTGQADGVRFGLRGLQDMTSRQRLEADACVSCGMCDDACPARMSGKDLSPRLLTESQKRVMDVAMVGRPRDADLDPEHATRAMECTGCLACESSCPLLIRKVDRIIGLRRQGLLEDGVTLPEWKSVLESCQRTGNIFGMEDNARTELLSQAGIPFLSPREKVDYVLWLGCYGAFDPTSRATVMALAALLAKAGKRLAALKEESCCGDMVRRIGDESLFIEMVEKNSYGLAALGDVPVLTICPHCCNSLGREYSQFGVTVNALHYTEILPELASSGALGEEASKNGGTGVIVAYHDSCYLARARGIIQQPRDFLAKTRPDAKRVSLSAEGQETLCCGGGAGRVAADEEKSRRISAVRIAEVHARGAQVLLTSCPYCLSLFSDAAGSAAAGVRAMDLLVFAAERVQAGKEVEAFTALAPRAIVSMG